jgi:excisionase family DNA binding protein
MTNAIAFSIADAVKMSGLGRTMIYGLIGSGKIHAVKAGTKTLIPAASLHDYLAGLPKAKIRTGQRGEA